MFLKWRHNQTMCLAIKGNVKFMHILNIAMMIEDHFYFSENSTIKTLHLQNCRAHFGFLKGQKHF